MLSLQGSGGGGRRGGGLPKKINKNPQLGAVPGSLPRPFIKDTALSFSKVALGAVLSLVGFNRGGQQRWV